MNTIRIQSTWPWVTTALSLLLALSAVGADTTTKLPAALLKPVPENAEDLKAIQNHVKSVIDKLMPTVVNVRIGFVQGSGVVVTEDGHILTAAHVSAQAGQAVEITFPDGKQVQGKTLGANTSIDSGMIKITTPGKYPFCPMGKSATLARGEWCLAIGHPGGLKPGRTPPVRLGRILNVNNNLIRTSCTVVDGDSGGPLFDMHGQVIGITSRSKSGAITDNIHVPVDTFRASWDRLAKGETWGGSGPGVPARLGVLADPQTKECKVFLVEPKSAAAKAGVRIGDVITAISGKKIANFEELRAEIAQRVPGDAITLEIRRGTEVLTLQVALSK